MATHPELPSPDPQRGRNRSWSNLVASARRAQPPQVDTRAAVLAAIAAESCAVVPVTDENDGWAEFARLFATPRLVMSGAASLCAAGPLALWVFNAGVARLDVFAKFLVYGGLPGWLVAIVA